MQKKSYAGQEISFAFPAKGGITEVPLGFQPLGISAMGPFIAIAAYFEPAVLLAEVTLGQGGVPHFNSIRWIRGTIAHGKRVRMFPNLIKPGDANRMQTVLMYSPTRMGLIRNGDRQIFPITLRADEKWEHESVSSFSFSHGGLDMVHSAVLTDQGLVTIESDEAADHWAVCDYRGKTVGKRAVPPFRYGIAVRHRDGAIVTVSDYRAKEHGLYFDDKRQVPDLVGNGVVLLDGGKRGALVTRYGQAYPGPFNGIPGALVYVPPDLL